MSQKLKELREKLNTAHAQAESFLAEARAKEGGLTVEDHNKADAMIAEARFLKKEIDLEERMGEMGSFLNQPQTQRIDFGEERSEVNEKELRSYLQGESRSMNTGDPAKGGALIPESMNDKIKSFKVKSSIVRSLADVISTSGRESMPFISSVGSAAFVGEGGSAVAPQDITTGKTTLEAKELIWATDVSKKLAMDTGYDLEGALAKAWGLEVGHREDVHFFNGAGTVGPRGILQDAGVGVTSASSTAITYDELVDLKFSISSPYRQAFIFSEDLIRVLTKMRDASGRKIWDPAERMADKFEGLPVYSTEALGLVGAGNSVALVGDLSYYVVADRGPAELVVDAVSKVREGKILYTGTNFVDGGLTISDAVKALKMKA